MVSDLNTGHLVLFSGASWTFGRGGDITLAGGGDLWETTSEAKNKLALILLFSSYVTKIISLRILKMTAFKVILLLSSRPSIPRNGLSSLYKLFSTSHSNSISKDPARLREFLNGKCKSGKINLDEAFYFFDYMIHMQPTPPMSCFSILFNALLKNNHYADVISLQKRLNSAGLVPDLFSLNILINCFSNTSRVCDGFVVFGAILRRGFNPSVVTFCSLIKACVEQAIPLLPFSCMNKGSMGIVNMVTFGNGIPADAVTFTAFIHGLCCVGDSKEAKSFFIQMLNQGVQPTIVTFGVLLDELCKNRKIDEANRLYKLKIERGVQPNTHTYSILMDGYCLVGRICDAEKFVSMASRVGDARKLLDEMQSVNVTPNSSIFTTFINGLCRNDCVLDALELFHTLENRKFQFTIEIFNCLIDGLSVLTAMGRLREAVLECEEALKLMLASGFSYIPGFKNCHMQAVDYSVPCSSKDAELVFSGGDGFC
ncbi:hypothetical protein Q3G72_015331 [Acer saccharum]|nr:hypothetical protein Q3G72_015331 [Acer saccharum]